MGDAAGYGGQGSLVEDDFDAFDSAGDAFGILQIALDELDAVAQMNQIVERPSAEVVQHADGFTL